MRHNEIASVIVIKYTDYFLMNLIDFYKWLNIFR